MKRRDVLKTIGLTTGLAAIPHIGFSEPKNAKSNFKYCLNTSTISGQMTGIQKYVEIAAQAGYDGVEIWVQDVKDFKAQGGSLKTLKKLLDDSHLTVYDAIGFAPWMVEDEQQRKAGFGQMKQEMELMAELGCTRIAAPAAGVKADETLNLVKVGERYKQLLELGRQTGVMPQLEFWGSSPVFYSMGQALMAAAAANDPDVKILPDVYHLFRGNSGFESLKLVNGNVIDVIHINDYPGTIAREEQKDKDRVYPGDGVAPLTQIFTDLANMGGIKILSLELFNPEYWKNDSLAIARTGLAKMRKVVGATKL
ncbi:MAG: sugar phosphate isomerase/epimerase [Cyclobacteriaceae bacterium]|nr:sugar phosphate isomerase/epimerase [Cyclobacteriaceae bacterium]